MATTPIGGAPNPWGWIPPEWDTSGGVAPGQLEQPLYEDPSAVDPVWPPPEWNAVPDPAESPVPDVAFAPPQPTQQLDVELGDAVIEDEPTEFDVELGDAVIEDETAEAAAPLPDNVEIDAISGGELPPPDPDEQLAAPAPAKGTKPKTAEELEAERIAALEQLDPEAFAEIQARQQIKLENERSTRELAESQRQRQLLEENVAGRQKAREAAKAELANVATRADELANGTPFQQWFSTRSGGQKLAGYISAMLGGFLAPQTGGRNSAIDFMMKLADDDANQKWTALRERKSIATDQLGQADEDYRNLEAYRLASYEQVGRALDAELAQLDPQGTAAVRIVAARKEVRARQAQAAAAVEEQAFDRAGKMIKAEQDQQRIEIDAAKAQSEIDKRNAEIAKLNRAGTGTGSAAKVKYDPKELAVRAGIDPKTVEGMPPMTVGEFNNVAEMLFKGKRVAEPTEGDKLAHTRRITSPIDGAVLVGKGGREDWVTGDPEETRVKMHAAYKIVDLLDEADAIRARVGGETSWGNSDDFQRLETIGRELLIARKAGTQGMSSDADMANLETAIGAKNLTSFRSQAARLKQARSMTKREINAWLKGHGGEGVELSFNNNYKAATKTPDQRELARIKATQTGEKGQSIPTIAAVTPIGAIARATESAVRDEDAGAALPADDKGQIDSWAKDARGGDAAARASIADLARENTRSPAVRRYAQGILADIEAKELAKATGKKPGDKGFLKALRTAVGYTTDATDQDDDEETEE